MDEVRKEKNELEKFWSNKFAALETKTEADRNKLVTDVKQKSFATETKLHQEQLKLNVLLEDNRKKTEDLEQKL